MPKAEVINSTGTNQPDPYVGTDILENLVEAENYNNKLVDLVRFFSKGSRTLDFGAGIGTFSKMCARFLKIDCLEIDEKHCQELKKSGFQVFKDFSEISDKYDYIYSLNVLEHIENDRAAALEIVENLPSGGRAFIFVPAFQILFSSLDEKVGHYRRYTRGSLADLFDGLPVKVSSLKYFDSVGFFAALVFKTLGMGADKVNRRNVIIFDRFLFPINRIADLVFSRLFGKNVYIVIDKI